MTLDAKIPDGPLAEKWDRHRFDSKLVNPANRRKYTVIIVGTGLAGGRDDRLRLALADEQRRPARGTVRELEARQRECREVPDRDGLALADWVRER